MATVNLGRIKPVFRGAYAGGTAYVIDDIVTSGGETFICIQASTGNATSSASHWTKLAEKGTNGTNGTDVGTTLTTQGDILYRDGSGLQRLPKGTAGQVLKMNSGATAPEYGTAPSGLVVAKYVSTETAVRNTTSGSFTKASNSLDLTITPQSASSKFLLQANFSGGTNLAGHRSRWTFFRDSTDLSGGNAFITQEVSGAYSQESPMSMLWLDSPNTTSQFVYSIQFNTQSTAYMGNNGYTVFFVTEYSS